MGLDLANACEAANEVKQSAALAATQSIGDCQFVWVLTLDGQCFIEIRGAFAASE